MISQPTGTVNRELPARSLRLTPAQPRRTIAAKEDAVLDFGSPPGKL